MNLEFRTNFTEEEYQSLREQDVCLDDWDYALLTHDMDAFEWIDSEEYDWNLKKDVPTKVLQAKDWNLNRLLVGCYDNKWRQITWNGKPAIIGFAYHA